MSPSTIPEQPWFLYVVECADGSYYAGISVNVARRVDVHNAGRGARYTASRRPVVLRASWRFSDRASAMRAEIAFKRKARSEKGRIIGTAAAFGDGRWVQE